MYPVLEILPELKRILGHNPVAILQAPPGAGKSTVLPLHLLQEPWMKDKKMILLEPRRLAARSVAHRLAAVAEEEVGQTVGYRIRFETKVSAQSRIIVVTEGILTRMMQHDNALEDVGMVIFDEFHERSLTSDLALALSLQMLRILRPDLRILLMSATLDGEKISSVLGNAPIVTASGRQFPVEHRYLVFDPNATLAMNMARAIRKAWKEAEGDILAFFPGAGEINKVAGMLESELPSASIFPLYGDLNMKQQQEAILPLAGRRKIVLATSIAETSLTIEGVSIVVDSGYSRVPRFDPRSGLNRLETVRVTRDAADQRSGRAGRLGPGISYRLWTESMNHNLVAHRSPEILEADLAPVMLELANWGVNNVNELTWITAPPPGAVKQALDILEQLEAIEDGRITVWGKKMVELPTHPRIAHLLLSASELIEKKYSGQALATDVAALLEERDPLGKEAGADITLRLEVLRKWRSGEKVSADRNVLERIERLAASWRRLLKIDQDNSVVADTDTGLLLTAAYPERIARQTSPRSERYKLTSGRMVKLPPQDPLVRESWLAIAELDASSGEGKIFIASPLNEDDLHHLAKEKESVRWDGEAGRVVGSRDKRIGSLVLESRPMTEIPETKRIHVLLEAIRLEGLATLGWNDEHIQWQTRVQVVRGWIPEEGWPDVSDDNLLRTLETWLSPYLHQVSRRSELQKLDLKSILSGILPWNLQQRLDVLAPEKISVPSGSLIRVNYFSDGRPPSMEVRLQEVFGLLETPAVNEGRTRVILHLLSPGFKPVQVTQDLKSFWQTMYHEVRSELRRRYPKHSWPEDPWTAEAVRGRVKK
jgi:ATP-dependent helicase HrpB